MQTDIFPFIVFDLDGDLRLGLAFGGLDVGLDDVVLPARGNSLGKFTSLVRHQVPLGLLSGGGTDRDGHVRYGVVVRPPHGSGNQGVVFGYGVLLWIGTGRRERGCHQRAAGCQQYQNGRAASGFTAAIRQPDAQATHLPLRP